MSLTAGGMKTGRDSILKLMEILGNPQDSLRVFHVTGSNGKWSVCQMLSQTLWKWFERKVWLFTSPHLVDISERFQINGESISHEKLDWYYHAILDLSKKYDIPFSFFEIQVITMILYFVDEKVDYAVVEVGLGGLYDGTNIFTHPLACIITSVTLEHTHVLGDTIESILENKLWILKPHTILYTPLSYPLIQETCEKIWVSIRQTKTPEDILTNLHGKHQQINAQIVIDILIDQGYDEGIIKDTLQNISHPGRYQWITPYILVDTANNRENIEILAKMVEEELWKDIITIFGTTQIDPDYAGELAWMVKSEKKILIDDFCERSLPIESYENTVSHDDVWHFFQDKEKIQKYLINAEKTIVIYGSIYLIWEIIKLSINKTFAS